MKIDKKCSCGFHIERLPETARLWALGEKIFKIFECPVCQSTLSIVVGLSYAAKRLKEEFESALEKKKKGEPHDTTNFDSRYPH